ncbi:MAG: AGE family epimerase/isomerase, partial [Acutalibacteraceae bacterium]|nr:AGE family epimerase/isomerase [Acutalibacteraceae bacterium]
MIKYLTENVLPFWLNNAIDEQFGGIFTCLDEKGNIYGEEKSVWFQGRALYIFSYAYNNVSQNPEYLKVAKKIYDFLPLCSDDSGRMFFTVTRDGREIQKRRYYFSETFAAIGCCEYWLASGDEKAKELAEKYFDIAYSIYKDPSLTTPKFNPENSKYHSLSPCMIMLSTAQVLRKINAEKYGRISKEMVPEILLHLTEKGLLENVSPEGEFVDTPVGRTVNPGHSLEAAWFLMAQGEIEGDNSLIESAKKIID